MKRSYAQGKRLGSQQRDLGLLPHAHLARYVFWENVRNGSCGSFSFTNGVGCIVSGSEGADEASCLRRRQRTRHTAKGEISISSSRMHAMPMSLFVSESFVRAPRCSSLPMISASSSNALLGTSAVCSCRWPLNSIGARTRLSAGPKFSSATPTIRTGSESRSNCWSKKRLGT